MEHKEYKSINKSVRKKDSMQLLLGKPVYTDDVTPDDALVVKILRSPHANAMVESINTAAAKKVPGVVVPRQSRSLSSLTSVTSTFSESLRCSEDLSLTSSIHIGARF